tara:strand:+ start:237 stop:473 length:237 start_codon:yes stop_codon:yes gene_type:complete
MHIPLFNINIPAYPMMVIRTMIPIVNFELFEQFDIFQDFIRIISSSDFEFDESPPGSTRKLKAESLPDFSREIPDQTS